MNDEISRIEARQHDLLSEWEKVRLRERDGRWSSMPGIGFFVRTLARIRNLGFLAAKQSALNDSYIAGTSALGRGIDAVNSSIEQARLDLKASMDALDSRLTSELEELEKRIAPLIGRLEQLEVQLRAVEQANTQQSSRLDALQAQGTRVEKNHSEVNNKLNAVTANITYLSSTLSASEARINQLNQDLMLHVSHVRYQEMMQRQATENDDETADHRLDGDTLIQLSAMLEQAIPQFAAANSVYISILDSRADSLILQCAEYFGPRAQASAPNDLVYRIDFTTGWNNLASINHDIARLSPGGLMVLITSAQRTNAVPTDPPGMYLDKVFSLTPENRVRVCAWKKP